MNEYTDTAYERMVNQPATQPPSQQLERIPQHCYSTCMRVQIIAACVLRCISSRHTSSSFGEPRYLSLWTPQAIGCIQYNVLSTTTWWHGSHLCAMLRLKPACATDTHMHLQGESAFCCSIPAALGSHQLEHHFAHSTPAFTPPSALHHCNYTAGMHWLFSHTH